MQWWRVKTFKRNTITHVNENIMFYLAVCDRVRLAMESGSGLGVFWGVFRCFTGLVGLGDVGFCLLTAILGVGGRLTVGAGSACFA